MRFELLFSTLLREINLRVRNGRVTVRSLARQAGISQPHLHHILQGKRGLNASNADRLMQALSLDLLDIQGLALAEAARPSAGTLNSHRDPFILVPMLEGVIGPGLPAPYPAKDPFYIPVPKSCLPDSAMLYGARLGYDAAAAPLLLADDLVVIAVSLRGGAPGDTSRPQVSAEADLGSPANGGLLVVEDRGSWVLRLPEAERRHLSAQAPGDPGTREASLAGAEEAQAASAKETGDPAYTEDRQEIAEIGVVVLCIRRLHPLRFQHRTVW